MILLSMQCDVIVLLCESTHCSVLNMVGKYTFMEMADMHIIFGCAYNDEVEENYLYQNISTRSKITEKYFL